MTTADHRRLPVPCDSSRKRNDRRLCPMNPKCHRPAVLSVTGKRATFSHVYTLNARGDKSLRNTADRLRCVPVSPRARCEQRVVSHV